MKLVIELNLEYYPEHRGKIMSAIDEILEKQLPEKLKEMNLLEKGVTFNGVLTVEEFENDIDVMDMQAEIEDLQNKNEELEEKVTELEYQLDNLEA